MTDSGPQGRDRLAKALEVALFAPLGVGLYLKDMAPSFLNIFVARGRAELDRRQEQVDRRVRHAKGMGEVAVAFGVPMLRKKADEKLTEARGRAEATLRTAGLRRDGEPARAGRPPRPETAAERSVPEAPRREAGVAAEADDAPVVRATGPTLAIPGYDSLSASQVVEHLAGLGGADLEAVRLYESSHRNRRTILGKIDQLTA